MGDFIRIKRLIRGKGGGKSKNSHVHSGQIGKVTHRFLETKNAGKLAFVLIHSENEKIIFYEEDFTEISEKEYFIGCLSG